MFKEKGWEVQAATGDKKKISKYCDKKYTISIERSPYKLKNLKAIKELKKIIDKENYDIIHCHTPMGSVVARLAARHARKNGTRVIYTAHGFHFFKGAPLINWLLFYPVEKYLAKYTDTLITINKEDYEWVENDYGRRDTLVIENVDDFSNIIIGDDIIVEFLDIHLGEAGRRMYMEVKEITDNKIICK